MNVEKSQLNVVIALFMVTLLGPLAAQVAAQPAPLPQRTEAYSWTSGRHFGTGDAFGDGVQAAELAVQDVISVPGSPWIQLTFDHTRLGSQSYIELKSLLDGATQRLDAAGLAQWNHRSAYFNGDAVEISLFVGPQDQAVTISISEVVVGEWASLSTKSICGSDNRVASNEPRVARIDPIGCTGWIASNGKLLTAGHCLASSGNTTLSFNVPPSLSNGTVQFPGPEDQYSINQGSFQYTNGGVGNDWGIFSVSDNSQTGLQPIEAQGAFDVRQDLGPSNIRITGFGVDSGTANQTNQTHVGPNAGSSGTTMRYATDTQGGNSGSPVIDEATGESVGIHTHGGCTSSGGNNSGTSFFHSNLWATLDAGGGGGGPTIDCPAGSIDFDTFALTSYSNQNVSNDTTVEDDGDILLLEGNTWVRSTQTFNITADTVIDFEFASGSQGEIHAIGFDNNDTLNDAPRHFQFWGTQNWTGTGKIDLTPKYSGGGDFQSYSVPVGQSYTGNMWLVFTNDKDSGTLNNESRFACVRVHEPSSSCDVNESFESGAGGWTTSGTCSTGTFTTGSPDGVSNGGVTTQVSGAQSGSSALFTQPNTGGAGTDDVDGGECVATSPVYNVTAASDVSAWYFHGQRDAGDDPSGDWFFLEVSINGGAWQTLANFGDVTSNAAWTEATTTASAGQTVQFRIRASDGPSAGDLVEAGIDNVTICAQ